MAKVSPNDIQSLGEDWGFDPEYGLPFGGQAVQAFIKSYLQNITAAAWFDTKNATMYFFASEADRDTFINDPEAHPTLPKFSCQMNFSGTLYQVKITNNNGSTNLNVATNSGTLPLSLSYVVQEKDITSTQWHDYASACRVSILIDRNMTGNYEALTEPAIYNPDTNLNFDIFPYLATGTNRVKFQFEEVDGKVTSALIYTITLAELYVEPFASTWYIPVLESDPATHGIGGFRIAGAGVKTFHIELYDETDTKVFEDQYLIGTTNKYATNPYTYEIADGSALLDLPTGIYKVVAYVSTTGISSQPVSYNIMFVAEEDTTTAQLVCVNDVADRIYNFSAEDLCHYSVYNGGSSYADLAVVYKWKESDVVKDSRTEPMSNIETAKERTLPFEVGWENIEGPDYSIGFAITLGGATEGGDVPIDNTTVFPPTPGYDFYMLPSNRGNGETGMRRLSIVNEANGAALPATWSGVDFLDGVDGWTVDDDGRRCLRIPAGTKVVLPNTSYNLLSGDNQTFEICYKVLNVADYDENVITLSPNPRDEGFKGFRIKPTNITVHSKENNDSRFDAEQGTNLCDDEPVHLVFTIKRQYGSRPNKNLFTAYINGCKGFMFDYTDMLSWLGINGDLTIGSEKSDICVYFIRHYNEALTKDAVQVNYVASLRSRDQRSAENDSILSVLDPSQTYLDFEAVKNSGYNFFVITMTQGNGVPSAANGWDKDTGGVSSLEMHFGEHPEWDWRMDELETAGQGTTSMNYYRWNIRWRIDKSNDGDQDKKKTVPVRYLVSRSRSGGRYIYEWGDASYANKVRFDGDQHPAVMRITAKINQASSMQSHKMGSTFAFNELHDAVGLSNEAQDGASPRPTVAVYQYPAFGFEYDPRTDTYTFIGEFTIGPDKGDKPTFGFDTVKNTLISLEGTDHNEAIATFSYPYIEGTGAGEVNYFYQEEGIAINKGEGAFSKGLEIGNCHGLEIDKKNKDGAAARDEDAIRQVLRSEFKPAYDLVWHNSTLIFPIALDDAVYGGADAEAVLANIRANRAAFISTPYAPDPRLNYGSMQFWIEGEYKLYWYNAIIGDFVAGDSLGEPTGETLEEQNENYKAARRAAFMVEAENWWDIQDALYHFVFCVLIGATDNFAKNTYPYKMAPHTNDPQTNGLWKWRQDDLDTIFDIDNLGKDTKPYQIEFMDANDGDPVFAGGRSVFWNLVYECYWEDYTSTVTGFSTRGGRTMGQDIIAAMTRISGANNPYDGFIKYFEQRYWNKAQNYFPISAYNEDAEFKYEEAWLSGRTEALPQALGNHFPGERFWVRRRAVYMLSLFRSGAFGNYAATNLGRMNFRPDAITYKPTPMMWLYPVMLTGQGGMVSGARTRPGQERSLPYMGTLGSTDFYFMATDYLSSLGDLKDLHLSSSLVATLGVNGKKLVNFKIGDADSALVTTNVPGLLFSNTPCLEEIDARNAESISAIAGLDECPRLRSLKLVGTTVTAVTIPVGSKLETLSLPETITQVSLKNLHHLSSISDDGYAAVTSVLVEDCPQIDAFALLSDVLEDSSVLRTIRLVWAGVIADDTAAILQAFVELDSGNYDGISASGETTAKPFIDGVADISGHSGEVIFPVWLHERDDAEYGEGKRIVSVSNFNTGLSVIYDPDNTRFVGFLQTSDGYRIKTSDGKYVTL